MRARDILSRPVVTVRRDTPLSSAVELLTTHGFAVLPVVDDGERVVGILSESDVMAALESRRGSAVVEVAMTRPVEVVEPTIEVSEVVKVALADGCRCRVRACGGYGTSCCRPTMTGAQLSPKARERTQPP